jgi:hypothetical protein
MKLVPSGLPESVRHHAHGVLGDSSIGSGRACGAGSTGIAGWQGDLARLDSLCR